MKLLLCLECTTLVQMKSEEKACDCGHVKGKYLEDNFTIAVKSNNLDKVRIVGIANDWLQKAVKGDDFPYPIPPENTWEIPDLNSLFFQRGRPIIMVYPFTTGDIVTYKEIEEDAASG